VYIAVSPKGFSQVVAIMPPNGRAMVMTLLLMEKSVGCTPGTLKAVRVALVEPVAYLKN
jgi:hypothetical protein